MNLARWMPSRSYLQFSLRGLLVAMAVVAAAITVYRWPWVEEVTEDYRWRGIAQVDGGFGYGEPEFEQGEWVATWKSWPTDRTDFSPPEPDVRVSTTYCRGWWGRPVKHGLQTYACREDEWRLTRLYENDELRRITLRNRDRVEEQSVRGGVPDGPYLYRNDRVSRIGNYRLGKRVGIWQFRYRAHGQWITARQEYDEGRVHGEWTWHDAAGQLLQSAKFERGSLALWNDQPWQDEWERWLSQHPVSEAQRIFFTTPIGQLRFSGSLGFNNFVHVQRNTAAAPAELLLWTPRLDSPDAVMYLLANEIQAAPHEPISKALVQSALLHSSTLSVRGGIISAVTICEPELQWRDRTGLAAVQFAAGSAQRVAWDGPTIVVCPQVIDSDWWFQSLFIGVPIQIAGNELNPGIDELPFHSGFQQAFYAWGDAPTFQLNQPCSRRDALFLMLATRNWSCEQRGDVLILHPYPAED